MVECREEDLLSTCFQAVTGVSPSAITPLSPHASERKIYRLSQGALQLIGVINSSRAENDAFVAFATHFKGVGLPVPKIHAYTPDQGLYLEDDLGDTTLLDLLNTERARTGEAFPVPAFKMYQRALEFLPRFQIEAAASFDFSKCLPPNEFFSHTLVHDMQAFSTELVGRILPNVAINGLQRDFASLIEFLSKAEKNYFVYRDFQSRNIMVLEDNLFFIDFQSGLRGPLQYDVASLLYQSSAQIPDEARAELIDTYLDAARRYARCERDEFLQFFPAFVVSRMIQVLGVYGRQGLGAKKDYFAKSIPRALETLHSQLTSDGFPLKLHGLTECSQVLLKALT